MFLPNTKPKSSRMPWDVRPCRGWHHGFVKTAADTCPKISTKVATPAAEWAQMTDQTRPITGASWNIHRGKGADGRIDPARIARVITDDICQPAPDFLVLQEADEDHPPHRGFLDLALIERQTGLSHVQGQPAARWGGASHGFLGVIVFANPLWQVQDVTLLDLPGHCHRGAVIVDLSQDGTAIRLIGAHLSLSQVLRAVQMRTLGQHLFRRTPRQTVLCGDLNEWRPWGGLALSPRIVGQSFTGPARATFPVQKPILPLDRILATAPARVISTRVLDSPDIRAASDHRPLQGVIEVTRAPDPHQHPD